VRHGATRAATDPAATAAKVVQVVMVGLELGVGRATSETAS